MWPPRAPLLVLLLAALCPLPGCGDEGVQCESYGSCRWGSCAGRRFRSCGPCPGGSIDTYYCQPLPPRDAGARDVVPSCHNVPCEAPVVCRAGDCAGAVVYRGCCECPATTVDESTCADAAVPTDGALDADDP